jgi:hypothetical protein
LASISKTLIWQTAARRHQPREVHEEPQSAIPVHNRHGATAARAVPDLKESGTALDSLLVALLIRKPRNTFREAL